MISLVGLAHTYIPLCKCALGKNLADKVLHHTLCCFHGVRHISAA